MTRPADDTLAETLHARIAAALQFAEAGPYGDLMMGAGRAAAIATRAVLDELAAHALPDRDRDWSADRVPSLGAGRTPYAAGFLLDDTGRVALVRKNRPSWQAGRLNAVGGHIEVGETPAQAMRREFAEEAGLDLAGWRHVATVAFDFGAVWFFRARVTAAVLDAVRSLTDEPIEIHDVASIGTLDALPNLAWLLPLAAYTHDTYAPLLAEEVPVADPSGEADWRTA